MKVGLRFLRQLTFPLGDQAILLTRGALHRFGRVNEIRVQKKVQYNNRQFKIQVKIRIDKIHKVKLISY